MDLVNHDMVFFTDKWSSVIGARDHVLHVYWVMHVLHIRLCTWGFGSSCLQLMVRLQSVKLTLFQYNILFLTNTFVRLQVWRLDRPVTSFGASMQHLQGNRPALHVQSPSPILLEYTINLERGIDPVLY